MVDVARALSFGSVAPDYHRYRPRTPAALLDRLLPSTAAHVVDLAAGTGALTELLVERVPRVTAVEPDPGMRAVLARAAPNAAIVEGTAEAIPLPDDCADAVLVSSAWHWFEPERAVPEIARVLRDGGRLTILGNTVDRQSGWITALRAAAGGRSGAPSETRVSSHREIELPAGSPFGPPERHEVSWTRPMPVDDVIGLLGTFSRTIVSTPEEKAAFEERTRAAIAEDPTTRGRDVVDVPILSWAWRADRVPR